jgi:hypothetical protein
LSDLPFARSRLLYKCQAMLRNDTYSSFTHENNP